MVRPQENELCRSSSSSYCTYNKLDHEAVTARRLLVSSYRSVRSLITDERDDMSRLDSVERPKEQVADLETLLDITSTLLTTVQSENKEGITISDYLSSLVRYWGQQSGATSSREDETLIAWTDIGLASADVFKSCSGFSTMIGPMNSKIKQQKAVVSKKHVRPTGNAQPEKLDDNLTKEKVGTDKNMLTVFNILKKNRKVSLENLVINKKSFAQTVENLFSLSFLVKDGRAEIKVDERDPRNAPTANSIASRETAYSHFVFRFDFNDWKLMGSVVEDGAELMPHRNEVHLPN